MSDEYRTQREWLLELASQLTTIAKEKDDATIDAVFDVLVDAGIIEVVDELPVRAPVVGQA